MLAAGMSNESTRIPAELNEEEAFFAYNDFKLSLRQVITVLFALFLWYALGSWLLGTLIRSTLIGMILSLPVIVGGIIIAFRRKNGVPYEEWLALKLLFRIESRRYSIVGDSRRDRGENEAGFGEASWEFDEEDDFVG